MQECVEGAEFSLSAALFIRNTAQTGAVTLIQRFGSALPEYPFAVHGRTNAASARMRRSGPHAVPRWCVC